MASESTQERTGAETPEVTIRPACPADIPTLRSLAERIWRAHYPGIISHAQIDYMLAWMYSPTTIAREMAEGVNWELLHVEGQPVGYLAYVRDSTETTVELNKLYLLPEWHGHGLGHLMLNHVRARSVAWGAHCIHLNVNKANTIAIRAYERAGFRVLKSVRNEIGAGYVMDDYVMTREPLV